MPKWLSRLGIRRGGVSKSQRRGKKQVQENATGFRSRRDAGTVPTEELSGHAVLVGHGRVGWRITEALLAERIPVVVAKQNREEVERLRALNPRLDVLLRTHTEAETDILRRDGMGTVFMGEAELARSMTERIVRDWAARRASRSP